MSREGRGAGVLVFPPFRLDVGDERLWKGTQELKLRRKPFAILRHLTSHPLRLVTQEELVEAVWGKIAMSESLLRTHVREVRRVLGEDVIETVIGRGYRFLREVETEKPVAAPPKERDVPVGARKLVGRDRETAILLDAFERVLSEQRQVVFLMGDPGIGKTALADDLVARVARPNGALVARGACVEQFGAGEAFLPVLDAVNALCRGPEGASVVEVLKRHAPMWIAQLPALVSDEALQAIVPRIQGATQPRMLRELAEAFDVLAATQPVVLVLEDIQWSDPSTTDLIAMLGVRREAARVLLLATCRPAELVRGEGLAKTIAQLGAHKQAISLHLENWPDASVGDYLNERFPDALFPLELPATIRRMTGGNPLFTGAVVDHLESRGAIRLLDGRWSFAADLTDVASHRPETVRQLIDIQIDRLKSDEQRILEAASVVGLDFVVGSVAHALAVPADDIDTACEALANDGRFLQFVATEAWPDGTLQSHYCFAHALYRHAALGRVPVATRRAWHRRIAEGLEASHAADLGGIFAELAVHFEEAQAFNEAVRYYCAAGERVMKRFGRAEALTHFNRARTLLTRLPTSEESERTELQALKHVGPAVIALRGFQDPDLEQTLDRTFRLAHKLGDDRAALSALLGLQRFYMLQGRLRSIEQFDGDIAAIVARLGDPISRAEAAIVSYSARLFRGQLDVARGPLSEATRVLDAAGSDPSRSVNAPVVGLWGTHTVILEWLGGEPDKAVSTASRVLAQATSTTDPFYLAAGLSVAALVHRLRREPERTFELSEKALQVSREAGTPLWQSRAMSLYHWAATALDPKAAQAHFEALSSGLKPLLEAGPYSRPAISLSVVEVFAQAGHVEEAMREIDEALAYVDESDERAWEPEMHRLRGDLLKDRHPADARRSFEKALEVAQAQGSRSFGLRAALSLAKLSPGDRDSDALEQLRQIHATFTEGLDTADLVEASALLAVGRPQRGERTPRSRERGR